MGRGALERLVASLAEGQWGLFTAAQARETGVSRVQLTRLVHDGMLTRLAHGVYVLRGAAGVEHLELRAAWLGLEPEAMAAERLRRRHQGAVVSHASAARLHQFGDLEADRHEFTLPMRKQTRRPDVRLHRGEVAPDEVATVAGLPTTTPERIIVDLLDDRRDGEHVAGVLADAVRQRAIDLDRLGARLAPFAVRFEFPPGRGDLVLEYLLDLGDVTDQVLADRIVSAARTKNPQGAQLISALESPQTRRHLVEMRRILEVVGLPEARRQTDQARRQLAEISPETRRQIKQAQRLLAEGDA